MSSFNWWVTASVAGPAVVSSIVNDHTFDQDSSLIHRNHPCKSKPVVTQFAAKTYRRLKAMLSGKRSDLDCRIIQRWKTHGPICRGHRDPAATADGKAWGVSGSDAEDLTSTFSRMSTWMSFSLNCGLMAFTRRRKRDSHISMLPSNVMTAGSVTSATLKVEPICASKVALFAPGGSYDLSNIFQWPLWG